MKQTNERLCALAQKGDAAALDSLIENNKSQVLYRQGGKRPLPQHESGTVWLEP